MKKYLLTIGLAIIASTTWSQVGIGNTSPNPSAILDLSNNQNKGFLPPSVALSATNSVAPFEKPPLGLLVYNTATAGSDPYKVSPGYYYFIGRGPGSDSLICWLSFFTQLKINVGDRMEGGTVFYVDATGQHGLIVADNDTPSYEIPFAQSGISEIGADGIGAGRTSTILILARLPNPWQSAVWYCTIYGFHYPDESVHYGDWYLPSLVELTLLKNYVTALPFRKRRTFSPAYWSSTTGGGISLSFSSGNLNATEAWVRPIRAF